jgi:hypothetical protein
MDRVPGRSHPGVPAGLGVQGDVRVRTGPPPARPSDCCLPSARDRSPVAAFPTLEATSGRLAIRARIREAGGPAGGGCRRCCGGGGPRPRRAQWPGCLSQSCRPSPGQLGAAAEGHVQPSRPPHGSSARRGAWRLRGIVCGLQLPRYGRVLEPARLPNCSPRGPRRRLAAGAQPAVLIVRTPVRQRAIDHIQPANLNRE